MSVADGTAVITAAWRSNLSTVYDLWSNIKQNLGYCYSDFSSYRCFLNVFNCLTKVKKEKGHVHSLSSLMLLAELQDVNGEKKADRLCQVTQAGPQIEPV